MNLFKNTNWVISYSFTPGDSKKGEADNNLQSIGETIAPSNHHLTFGQKVLNSKPLFIGLLYIISAYIVLFLCSTYAQAQISTPQDVPGLVFWVDATDVNSNGVQPADNSVVTRWVDKSGNGNNLTTTAGTITFEATGFGGIKPGLRFPSGADMDAANPFSGVTQNAITLFFVMADVTRTSNFAVSLNGHRIWVANRFSFHAPWLDGNIYFDAGGCCTQTRLSGVFPNAVTQTTLITGFNDQPGQSQRLRIDGRAFRADATANNARVSRGIHLGSLSASRPYDGRFAEVLIYDRALTRGEITDVECLLLLKWKLSAAPAGCRVVVSANKTVNVWDPTASGLYAVPGNDVIYTITMTHESGPNLDAGTVFIADTLPAETIFYNGDIDDTGPETNPVSFADTSSGLTLNYATDVKFSDSDTKPKNMSDCTYTPTTGYDASVRHVCIKPSDAFSSGTPDPSFSISFRARIK